MTPRETESIADEIRRVAASLKPTAMVAVHPDDARGRRYRELCEAANVVYQESPFVPRGRLFVFDLDEIGAAP